MNIYAIVHDVNDKEVESKELHEKVRLFAVLFQFNPCYELYESFTDFGLPQT